MASDEWSERGLGGFGASSAGLLLHSERMLFTMEIAGG